VIVQANAVIGAAGFSYDTATPSNVDAARGLDVEPIVQPWIRIPSVGIVEVGDDVEIGAGACIDRPTLGVSRIGAGTKIDNLVQIAHHVQIGEHCLLAAQVGVAGSCVIEDGAVLGGQVGVVDHQRIGRLAVVLAGADVHSDIPPAEVVAGAPARPRWEWFRRLGAAGRVDRLRRRLDSLEARLAALEGGG
jgi:UDP-3-O-[3-hydroxymyristoyl] glucosamine N-acyltransferase